MYLVRVASYRGLHADEDDRLELKSSDGPTETESGGNAVLCTANKTFNVRQKNSSNSVYILQPSKNLPDLPSITGVEAMAKCQSTLELTVCKASAAAAYMKRMLPTYFSNGFANSETALEKHQLFDGIPFSREECEDAYRELAVIRHPDSGMCFRPTAQVKIQVWHAIVETAVAAGIDLTLPVVGKDLLSLIDGDKHDSTIAEAVLDAVTLPSDGASVIDAERCVKWTGTNRLEADLVVGETTTTDFVARWKDLLPEKWRSMAELGKLAGHYRRVNDGKHIQYQETFVDGEGKLSNGVVAPNDPGAGQKRKWHEKFRPTKKTS